MVTVIPAVNCMDRECAEQKVRIAERFFPFGDGWIHLDVADGTFTFNKTWGDPEGWKSLHSKLKLEVHLMVLKPEQILEPWLKAGAKRVILHMETMKKPDYVLEQCTAYDAEPMLSVSPETRVENLRPYFEKFHAFQVLAVNPGFAGQSFLPLSLQKIKFLREHYPTATIEVDGGVNLTVAHRAQKAGAHVLVAASYIYGDENPARAFNALQSIE